jgi:nucleotide-binding universal stress UspA family protein
MRRAASGRGTRESCGLLESRDVDATATGRSRATPERGSDRVAAVPSDAHAAPTFRRAVVALSGHPNGQRLVRLVAELAKAHKAELIGVHVVEIDWSMPLDMDVAGRSEEIQRVLDVAEGTAESAGVKLEPVLLQARDVGAALVDETVEREADLLVVGLAYRTKFGGDFAIGRTIPYILKNAPCAVWVVREPIQEEIQ